jgi:hypothetical protein
MMTPDDDSHSDDSHSDDSDSDAGHDMTAVNSTINCKEVL